jgi:hypothetical protein
MRSSHQETAMPPGLPLHIVVLEVVKHTPPWVWALLAALVVLGSLQLRSHEQSRPRVLALPLAMGGFSLFGALSAFGPQGAVFAAWALGLGVTLAAGPRWPRGVRHLAASDRFVLAGSVLPLLAMLAVFGVRYIVAVALALHREWAAEAAFAIGASLVYGALSGLFVARARHILASAVRPQSTDAAAA